MGKIPKIIHYCWFGNNPKSQLIEKCIDSWKRKLPDYQIIEWNEENFNVNMNEYVSNAYKQKKWAFVSDYARLYALYNMGGIYLDTDMEVLKNLDQFLDCELMIGCEHPEIINAAIIGASKKNKFICEVMRVYENEISDSYKTIPRIITDICKPKGFTKCNEVLNLEGLTIYPKDYFYPKDLITHKLKITPNTFCIHHYDASWMTPYQKIRSYILSNIYNIYKISKSRLKSISWTQKS